MLIATETAKVPEGQQVGPFLISPSDRWTGRLYQGSSDSIVFIITSTDPQARQITKVTADSQMFSGKIETLETGRRWMITIVNSALLKAGAVSDTIRIATDSSAYPELRIQLQAGVEPVIVAMPNKVNFGVLPISNPEFDAGRTGKFIFLRQLRGAGLEVRKVSSTLPFLRTEVQEDVKGVSCRILIMFDKEKLTAGEYSGKITIETNNPITPVAEVSITLRAQ